MRRPPVSMSEVMERQGSVTDVAHADSRDSADFEHRVSEAEAASTEVVERQAESRKLRDVGEVLEELNRIVTDVAADDDVAPSTVALVRETANQTLRRTAQRLKDIPATENAMTHREHLMLSVESIGETLKQVWEAIKKAAERVYDALLKVVMGFIGVLESALRLAEDMQKDLPTLNWADATAVPSPYAKYLSINNKLSAQWPREVLTDLQRAVQIDHEIYDMASKVADDYVADFESAMRKNAITENWAAQAARCQGLFKGLRLKLASVATTPSSKPEAGAKGTVVYRSGLLPGERRIQFTAPEEGLDDVPFMVAFEHCLMSPGSVVRERYPQNAARPEIDKLPAVEKGLLKDAVDGLVKLLKDMLAAQEARKKEAQQRRAKIGMMNMEMAKPLTDEALDTQSRNLLLVLAKMASMPMALDRPVDKFLLEAVPHYTQALRQMVKAYS